MTVNLQKIFRKKQSRKFHKAKFLESSRYLRNPGCGWYRIYTFHAEDRLQEFYLECEEEELVLVLIDIGCFSQTELSRDALEYIAEILEFFRSKDKGIILRFAYDTNGNGLLREPQTGSLVITHMRQIGSVVREFADEILVIQGILVGSWGEMHDSRFLSKRWMTELAETMLKSVDYRCMLAVRKPSQWRTIAENSSEKVKKKLALFNDGIFGTETDMGTYGTEIKAFPEESWCRSEELKWQQTEVQSRINGGEVLGIKVCREAAEDMKKMHLSYLNSVYSAKVLDDWKATVEVWTESGKEQSAYDYIGQHLGYRFLVRDAVFKRGEIQITVENCGFANLCEEAECHLMLRTEGEEHVISIETDARKWNSGTSTRVSVRLDETLIRAGMKCCLQLRRKRDERILSFANEGAGESVLIGQFGDPC